MTADLEFRDLVSRPVWGHPAVMVEECFENISLKYKLTDKYGEKGAKFVICIILSQ